MMPNIFATLGGVFKAHSDVATTTGTAVAGSDAGPSGFVRFLDFAGQDVKNILRVEDTIFTRAEPLLLTAAKVLQVVQPGPGAVAATTAINTAIMVQQQFEAIGAGSGNSAAKLNAAMQVAGPVVVSELQATGHPNAEAAAKQYISDAVTILNLDPRILQQLSQVFQPLGSSSVPAAPTAPPAAPPVIAPATSPVPAA
jgi:hypothetical protein